jgi:hypothetical protein
MGRRALGSAATALLLEIRSICLLNPDRGKQYLLYQLCNRVLRIGRRGGLRSLGRGLLDSRNAHRLNPNC